MLPPSVYRLPPLQCSTDKNMSVKFTCMSPQPPLLYRKTGVCRGIPNFLIFVSKHRLWVLARTTSARRFYCVPTIYVLGEKIKKNHFFSIFLCFASENNLCILHPCVFVMTVLDQTVMPKLAYIALNKTEKITIPVCNTVVLSLQGTH